MSRYRAKDALVQGRQLKVNTLVIPFQVVGNGTPADVVLTNDESGLMFLQSEGVNQISAALDTNETAVYTDASPSDAAGELNCLIKIREDIEKVLGTDLLNLDDDGFAVLDKSAAGANSGSTSGISTGSGGGKSLMLSMDTGADHSSGTHKRALVVHYVAAE